MTTLTVLGLGPGDPGALTSEARKHLNTAQHIVVATSAHPVVQLVLPGLALESFDALYDRRDGWGTLPHRIAAALVGRAAAGESITFAVPGHPLIGNLSVARIRSLAPEHGVEIRIIGGLSLVDQIYEVFDGDIAADGVQIIDALALLSEPDFPAAAEPAQRAWSELQGVATYTPPLVPFPLQPTQAALLCHPDRRMLGALKQRLRDRYRSDHAIGVIMEDAPGRYTLHSVALNQLDTDLPASDPVALYIAPLPIHDDIHDVQALNWVTARLLGPAGCPWDREQTHASLRRYLLEEAHEVLEALDAEEWDALSEELGDLLLQIVLHSEMARQAGRFTFGTVTAHITQKLIRRHPHVFGDLAVSGSGEVLRNWEAIKAEERAAKGSRRESLLDGVPASLPALSAAQLLGEKAAKVGFDWADIGGVWDKIHEELREIRSAAPEQQSEEFGDLLFVLARLASWSGVDAEAALRSANVKFKRRFAACERLANGRDLARMSADQLDALWNEAKRQEARSPRDQE